MKRMRQKRRESGEVFYTRYNFRPIPRSILSHISIHSVKPNQIRNFSTFHVTETESEAFE